MILNNTEYDTITVSLGNPITGLYILAYTGKDGANWKIIAECFGFENSTRAANALALDRVEYVTAPVCKPMQDTSEYP